jgi:tRNA ligase
LLYRGDSHQKLTPALVPQYETVIWNFIKDFEPLRAMRIEDQGIDASIKLSIDSTLQHRVESILKALGWPIPPHTAKVVESMIAKSGVAAQQKQQKQQSSPQPSTPKKQPKVRYYGIDINFDLKSHLASVFGQQQLPQHRKVWETLTSLPFGPVRNYHVTLALGPRFECEKSAKLRGKLEEMITSSRLAKLSIQDTEEKKDVENGTSPLEVEFEIEEVLWNDKIMAVPVVKLPGILETINKHPHITIGVFKEEVRHVESNRLLEDVEMTSGVGFSDGVSGWEKEQEGGREDVVWEGAGRYGKWVRLGFGRRVKVQGRVREFYY